MMYQADSMTIYNGRLYVLHTWEDQRRGSCSVFDTLTLDVIVDQVEKFGKNQDFVGMQLAVDNTLMVVSNQMKGTVDYWGLRWPEPPEKIGSKKFKRKITAVALNNSNLFVATRTTIAILEYQNQNQRTTSQKWKFLAEVSLKNISFPHYLNTFMMNLSVSRHYIYVGSKEDHFTYMFAILPKTTNDANGEERDH